MQHKIMCLSIYPDKNLQLVSDKNSPANPSSRAKINSKIKKDLSLQHLHLLPDLFRVFVLHIAGKQEEIDVFYKTFQ